MSSFRNRTLRSCRLLLVCFCFGTAELRAQRKEPDQILFLNLRMTNGVITLVNAMPTPGVLKSRRGADKKGPIQLEVETAAGTSLWNETMSDPSVRRYEYEDPDHPGGIISKVVQLNEVQFSVRIPFNKEARRVSFYRVAPSETSKAQVAPPARPPKAVKELIARIDLPDEEGK